MASQNTPATPHHNKREVLGAAIISVAILCGALIAPMLGATLPETMVATGLSGQVGILAAAIVNGWSKKVPAWHGFVSVALIALLIVAVII